MTKRRLVLAPLLAVVVVAAWVRLPYYSVGPGPAREVMPLIRVGERPVYPSQGKLVMTSVEFRQLTPLDALLAWLDPAREVVPRRELFLPGETAAQEEERARSEMDRSQIDAVSVALSALGDYPEEHGRGAVVESVIAGCPADGKLFPGDVVLAIDGDPVRDRAGAGWAIDAVPAGELLTFSIRAGGERQDVGLTRERCAGAKPLVGIVLIDDFPFAVRMESSDVGGPSAGLMFALGLYDLLTPEDLTGGRTIAGTGVIDLDGRVRGIGGIEQKVVAAERAGADLFVFPERNLEAARRASGDGMRLVPVGSFDEALEALGS